MGSFKDPLPADPDDLYLLGRIIYNGFDFRVADKKVFLSANEVGMKSQSIIDFFSSAAWT